MTQAESLAGKFLIAMPCLTDPNFDRSVVLVCAHNQDGAMGLVVNRVHFVTMEDVLQQLEVSWGRRLLPPVYQGGPVGPERGFIIYEHEIDLPGVIPVPPGLFMGTNPELLHRLALAEERERFLFALGYAGWGGGQLERELRDNAWLVAPVDLHILFDVPPEKRWEAAIRSLGIDPAHLVDTLDMGVGQAN